MRSARRRRAGKGAVPFSPAAARASTVRVDHRNSLTTASFQKAEGDQADVHGRTAAGKRRILPANTLRSERPWKFAVYVMSWLTKAIY